MTGVNKRSRRTRAALTAIRGAIYGELHSDHPQTCRSVFYRLVSRGVIDKTEAAYKGTVIRLLTEMRLQGAIPFGWITDGTRLRRRPETFSGLRQALERTRDVYRRAMWDDVDAHVEVWSEKEAIAGVLLQETWPWDVPLFTCRGYPSVTYLHDAAQEIAALGKPAWLYYFGDWDPSGLDIARNVEARIRQFAPDAEVHFERVAVTARQIEDLELPTRPTKRTDSRARGFRGESVEVDAIPPAELRRIARACIQQHMPSGELKRLADIEDAERETLEAVLGMAAGASLEGLGP